MGDLMNTTIQILGYFVLLVQTYYNFIPQNFEYFLFYSFAVQVGWLSDDVNDPHKPDKNCDFYSLS